MSGCDSLLVPSSGSWSARAAGLRTGCPPWCAGEDCTSGHESPSGQLTAEHDAALLSTRLLALDGAAADGGRLVLVSIQTRQLELLDKPSVELLPHEARRLATSLLRLADLAERAGRPTPARHRRGGEVGAVS